MGASPPHTASGASAASQSQRLGFLGNKTAEINQYPRLCNDFLHTSRNFSSNSPSATLE
jgi:hypothetical protein